MKNLLSCSFIAALSFTCGCAQRQDTTKTAGPTSSKPPAKESAKGEDAVNKNAPIGTATMTQDGTIILQLRAESPGIVGEGRFVYAKDNKDYAGVLKHLGGLKPGESKPVPPWPDK